MRPHKTALLNRNSYIDRAGGRTGQGESKVITSQLGKRMIFMLVAGIVLSLGILTYLINWKGTSILLSYDRDRSALMVKDITRQIREVMLAEKKPAAIRQLLANHDLPGTVQTALFRGDGTLYAGKTEYNVPVGMFSAPREASIRDHGHQIFFMPLLNETACQQCHASDLHMLGVLMVDISTNKMHAAISEIRSNMIISAIVVAVLGSLSLILILNRMVFSPLAALREAANIIDSGELHRRINIGNKDEFGILASTFNHMAESLETSHLNLERALQQRTAEKDFSDAIFDSTATGIMVIDRKGRVQKLNNAGAQILGRDVEFMVGEDITSHHPEMSNFLLIGSSFGQEVLIKTADDRMLPIGYTSSLLPKSHGREEGIIVMFRNLSEIKKLQASLKKKEHFETIGKVVSGVAHEVRNPLFGISSIGQILERESDNPKHQALISAMLRECDRLKNLIEELLTYTRPARLDIRQINLALFFMELEHHIKGKRDGINISVQIPPSLTISADRDKITQVLLNVLNNAIEAAQTGVTVTAADAGDQTEIRIEDDGPGIPQKNREKIFEPFFTTKKGGTGLGLSICKKLIEDQEGSIEIISREGKGTEVVLKLRS